MESNAFQGMNARSALGARALIIAPPGPHCLRQCPGVRPLIDDSPDHRFGPDGPTSASPPSRGAKVRARHVTGRGTAPPFHCPPPALSRHRPFGGNGIGKKSHGFLSRRASRARRSSGMNSPGKTKTAARAKTQAAGELINRRQTAALAFRQSPEHAPMPPRPLGNRGDTI